MKARAVAELSRLQNEVLEAVATGVAFKQVADLLCRRAEEMAPGTICTIMEIGEDGVVRRVTAPGLPPGVAASFSGLMIGPEAGSCGSAAYTMLSVEVNDIETDSRWADYKDTVLPLGLRACWSSPILVGDKSRALATFAFYFRENRRPNDLERQLVKTCVHLCSIALERWEINERKNFLAYNDQLTGLPNRFSFDERLAALMSGGDSVFSLLMIDIDNLKLVNDSMGHLVGDTLIKEVANRISSILVEGKVHRLGGDEFAVICPRCLDDEALKNMAEKLSLAMESPFECAGNSVFPQVTMGGVVRQPGENNVDLLRQNADLALYHAKETRRGSFVRFRPGLRTSIEQRSEQIQRLNVALDEGRVFPFYQPVVDLQSAKICGVEALARIREPNGQIVTASTFERALSDSKNAHRLTACMIEQVAKTVRTWLDAGISLQHVAINLSTADFHRGNIVSRLIDGFSEAGVPLHCVQIEVTESVLMDSRVARNVAHLRREGMQIALDDFGTGHASLSHLRDFPVDFIKIDKSFIDNLLTDTPSSAIVEALIDIARKTNLGIIAEGIETEEQAARLIKFGCPLGQGYLFARPTDAQATSELLSALGGRTGSLPLQGGAKVVA